MRRKLHARLQKAKLFTAIWIDELFNEGNMVTTIPAAISRSQVVFVLLSADYCKSDTCRREFEFALNKKVPTYFLFVQEDFKVGHVDWVYFLIGNNLYYRIDHDPTLEKLIVDLTNSLSLSSSQPKLPNKEVKAPLPVKPSGSKSYLKKRSVDQWTSEDIQEWCYDNAFDAWAELLHHYDGKTLLALHRTLSIDLQLSNFVTLHNLNVIEVVRFKYKLAELIHKPLETQIASQQRNSRLKL